MSILWAIIVGSLFVAFVYFAFGRWARLMEPTPLEKLNNIVAQEAEKLGRAQRALLKSEEYIHELERELQLLTSDIEVLKKRIADTQDEARARALTVTLISKEQQQKKQQKRLAEAMKGHGVNVQTVGNFQEQIRELRSQVASLQVQHGLAVAEQDAATLEVGQTNLDTTGFNALKEEVEGKVAAARAAAEVDSRLARKGSDFLGAGYASVDARMAELRHKP